MARKPKKSKRFTYNLQSVLKYRNIREDQEKEAFSKAEQKYKEELTKEEKIKHFQSEKYTELRGQISDGKSIDFQQVLMRKSHLEVLKGQVEDQEKSREEAEDKKEEKREDLVKAVKDRKILDKDKEKKKEQWQKVMKKVEEEFLNEVATIAHVRKNKQSKET
jgi:flagellar protein FliJ